MNRLTIKGFNYDSDFVASHLQSWPIAEALKKLQQIENAMEERELHQTIFNQITASPDKLTETLENITFFDGPWDDAFHRLYCDVCQEKNCVDVNCKQRKFRRGRIRWWLELEIKL